MNDTIYQSISLPCSLPEAFSMFIQKQKVETWLCQVAEIEPKLNGKYELFWDKNDKMHNHTVGCKITVYDFNRVLAFQWKGPQKFASFMNQCDPLTHVGVLFSQQANCTTVSLLHSGFRHTEKWEQAYHWFILAWQQAFTALEQAVQGKLSKNYW